VNRRKSRVGPAPVRNKYRRNELSTKRLTCTFNDIIYYTLLPIFFFKLESTKKDLQDLANLFLVISI
jgi:hypothetical protein